MHSENCVYLKNSQLEQKQIEVMPDRPNIAGSFNSWNPEPMQNLTDFLQKMGPPEKQITNEKMFEDLISDPKFR